MKYWIAFFQLFTYLVITTVIDYVLIVNHVQIRHGLHLFIELALLYGILDINVRFLGMKPRQAIGTAILYPGLRWIITDYGLNLLRGLPLDYLGLEGNKDAFTDKALAWLQAFFSVEASWILHISRIIFLVFCLIFSLSVYRGSLLSGWTSGFRNPQKRNLLSSDAGRDNAEDAASKER